MTKEKAKTDSNFRPADLVDQRDLVNLAKNEKKVGARATMPEGRCDLPDDPEMKPDDVVDEDQPPNAEDKPKRSLELPAREPARYFRSDELECVELEIAQNYEQAPASQHDEMQPDYPNHQDWNDEECKASPLRPDPRC